MKRFVGVLAGALLLILSSQPLQAGGWASVTLDGWPSQWIVGEHYTLGITIRAHGQHPVTMDQSVTVVARHATSGETVEVKATLAEDRPYYRTDMMLPYAGEWQFTIKPGWMLDTVVTTQAVEARPLQAVARWWMTLPLMAAVAGLAVLRRRTGLRYIAAVGVAVLVITPLLWLRADESYAADQVRYGRELFAVKGCVACHRHAEVKAEWSSEMGPLLTDYKPDEAWTRRWLANPADLRPATLMPDLELAPHEVDALIAFLAN